MSLTFCSGSPTRHHKLGALHFIDKKREQFVQSCRYCFGVRTARIVIDENRAPRILHERFDYPEGDKVEQRKSA